MQVPVEASLRGFRGDDKTFPYFSSLNQDRHVVCSVERGLSSSLTLLPEFIMSARVLLHFAFSIFTKTSRTENSYNMAGCRVTSSGYMLTLDTIALHTLRDEK